MKRIFLLGTLCLLMLTGTVLAAPGPVVGDKGLLDASADKGLLINLDELENLNRTEIGTLKELITKTHIRIRTAYGQLSNKPGQVNRFTLPCNGR